MKVDGLSKENRALAILDWFEYTLGYTAPELCIKTYYDTGVKEIKESIRGLYNRYWEILKNTFAIEPYQIDFNAHTKEDCAVLLEDIRNYMNTDVIGSDRDGFLDKIEDSSCKWDQFLREMSMTLINIHTNSFIGTSSDIEVFRALNMPGCTFDDLVAAIEKNIDVAVIVFIRKASLILRLNALISTLSSLRSVYYQCGRDIHSMLNASEDVGENSEFTQDVVQKLQKAFDNIKDFEHYRSLFIEWRDICNEDVNSDPMELLEKYYKILDEIYFDVYSLGTLVPSLIVKYDESRGGNEK